jgi:hypothetical protein
VCDFNAIIEKHNAARAAYDRELELIERDLGFDLFDAVHLLKTEGGEVGDRAASRLRHAWREFDWRRRYARRLLQRAEERQ